MSIIVETPFQNFTGLDGKPLTNGKVYIGQVGTDPTVFANQIPVFWDEALTIPASQPLTTNAGYIVRTGTPARVWVASDYSISVKNASNVLVYYIAQFGVVDYVTSGDLAGPTGASLVGWKRDAIGAINRPLSLWVEEFPLTPRAFGCACDGVTIDNVNFGKFLDACAGRWGTIPDGDLVRLTVSPTALTTHEVRLRGRSNQWHTGQQTIGAGRDYGGILLDGEETAIGGTWDLGTNTVTYPQRVKGLCNLVVAGINGSRHGLLDFIDNGVFSGLHFQDFTDHHMFTFGAVLNTFRDISGCGTLPGKAASGTWLANTFMNGCGWLCTGSAPSGVAGNFLTGKTFGSSNFSSTNDVSNVFFDTAVTQTTSGKGFIFYNTRSTTMKNCGSYSGVYQAFCNIQWDSPHMETYATGGEVAGDGNPQSFVSLNSTVQTANYDGGSVYPPVILRTTPFTAATDFWMYDLQTTSRRQFSRIGVNELILGEKLAAGSTASQHVASLGTVANPMVYFDKLLNALRVSCGLSFQPFLSIPIILPGVVPAVDFVDINSADLCPPVDGGSGPGGIYDIDVQILDAANGKVFYFGTWVGARQIPGGQYAIRFYGNGKDNNPPAGGFTVTESFAASIYRLRITNGTAAPYAYRLTSRLRCVTIPQPV